MPYRIYGQVLEDGAPIVAMVRAYLRSSGAFVAEEWSSTSGEFVFSAYPEFDDGIEFYVIALDPDGGSEYNALIFDRVVPVLELAEGEHRYWRIKDIQTGGGFLEISELRLFVGGDDVTAFASKTSSHVPTEALSNLFDGLLNTRCYWPEATVEGGSFWIEFDFGANQERPVDGVKQGGFDTSSRYMHAFTLEYSDDGSTWFSAGSKSGLTYPGNYTLSGLYSFP